MYTLQARIHKWGRIHIFCSELYPLTLYFPSPTISPQISFFPFSWIIFHFVHMSEFHYPVQSIGEHLVLFHFQDTIKYNSNKYILSSKILDLYICLFCVYDCFVCICVWCPMCAWCLLMSEDCIWFPKSGLQSVESHHVFAGVLCKSNKLLLTDEPSFQPIIEYLLSIWQYLLFI